MAEVCHLGQDTWNEATGPTITHVDTRISAANGRAALDSGFFSVRWDRGTRAEQTYMRAMAEDGDNGTQGRTDGGRTVERRIGAHHDWRGAQLGRDFQRVGDQPFGSAGEPHDPLRRRWPTITGAD